MAVKEIEYYYGAVFYRLINSKCSLIINPLDYETKGFFIINNSIPLYIKYTAKRLTPWSFSFFKVHQDDFQRAKDEYGVAFVAFVCGSDGICCLEYEDFKKVLDYVHEDVEWVRISRKKGESYGIKGTDGKIRGKISDCDFPKVILDVLTSPVNTSCK